MMIIDGGSEHGPGRKIPHPPVFFLYTALEEGFLDRDGRGL